MQLVRARAFAHSRIHAHARAFKLDIHLCLGRRLLVRLRFGGCHRRCVGIGRRFRFLLRSCGRGLVRVLLGELGGYE